MNDPPGASTRRTSATAGSSVPGSEHSTPLARTVRKLPSAKGSRYASPRRTARCTARRRPARVAFADLEAPGGRLRQQPAAAEQVRHAAVTAAEIEHRRLEP